jgi:NAD(P)-dependent dehydrogenase (short-subunit alcohol dehydrogenase family)
MVRGVEVSSRGVSRATGDTMGMLATVMNCLALEAAIQRKGMPAQALSAFVMPEVCELFTRAAAHKSLAEGRILQARCPRLRGPDEEEDAQQTVRLIEDAGRRAVTVPGDIRREEHCQLIIDTAVRELGGIDILVNNAAYQMTQQGGIEDITTEQWDRVLKTNLYATFWLTKMAVPHLRPGSSIINTASIQATEPSPELLDYATTKAGIVNFGKGLAKMLADKGIRVNNGAPGPIWTPLIPATMNSEKAEAHGESTPLGRPGQPAEVAPAYVFFASQEASYITGETLGVTGGKSVL